MQFLGSNQTSTILIVHMDHLSAAGSSATRNLSTTEPPKSPNRRKTVNFRFQRPHATSGSFFFNKPMRVMDSRRDFTSKKVFPGYFPELSEKANSGLTRSSFLLHAAHHPFQYTRLSRAPRHPAKRSQCRSGDLVPRRHRERVTAL